MTTENELAFKVASPKKAETAITVFHRIAQAWGVNDSEESKLLGCSVGTDEVMSGDALERISYVFGIYKNLCIIFPNEQQANGWIRRPNKDFDGRPAIDVMIEDPSIVRRHLDAQLI